MTIDQVKALHRGDHVKWNDPDHGICTRVIKIDHVEIKGNGIVLVWGEHGDFIQVFAGELE